MIRVAVVQEQVDPRRGGAESSVLEMVRHLNQLGAQAVLVTASPLEAGPDLSLALELRRVRGKLARTRRFVESVERRLRDESRFDLVLAVTPVRGADVYQPRGGLYDDTIECSLDATRSAALRWIKRAARALNRRQQYLRGVERALLTGPRPPVVACVSALVQAQVVRRFPQAAAHARVIFNGVDTEPLAPADAERARAEWRARLEPRDRPLILFAAHNPRLKGLAELIAAAAVARRGGAPWRVVVAGRDPPAPFRRRAVRFGVAQDVCFVGPQNDLRGLYAACDVLAHPTWYDPCSRVVLEALICGLPVVTTRRNGAAEAVTSANGRVVDSPANRAGLATAIGECLRMQRPSPDRELRRRLSMRRHAEELATLLERVSAARSAGAMASGPP